MDKRLGAIFLGAITAVVVGAWLITRNEDDEWTGGVLDSLANAVALLTSSEESRLAKLETETQSRVRSLLDALAADGLGVHVGRTLGTPADTAANVESGHSAVKTHSMHEIGRAADLYVINLDTGKPDYDGIREDLYLQLHQKAATFGLGNVSFNADWSPRYLTLKSGKKLRDLAHVEYLGSYGSYAEAIAAEGADYGIA
jgi:hypothetical protein